MEEESFESESDDDEEFQVKPSKKKPTKATKKKAAKPPARPKRAAAPKKKIVEESEEEFIGDDDMSSDDEREMDINNPENLIKDETDRKYLDSLPELDREAILAERFDKAKEKQDMQKAMREAKYVVPPSIELLFLACLKQTDWVHFAYCLQTKRRRKSSCRQ